MGDVLQGGRYTKKGCQGEKKGENKATGTAAGSRYVERARPYPEEKLKVKIPQRQFIGESAELNKQIRQTVEAEIRNILK